VFSVLTPAIDAPWSRASHAPGRYVAQEVLKHVLRVTARKHKVFRPDSFWQRFCLDRKMLEAAPLKRSTINLVLNGSFGG
jgi:hypothetical protein